MKRKLAIIALLLLISLMVFVDVIGYRVVFADSYHRFELLQQERHDEDGILSTDLIKTYHDKESGVEFICVYGGTHDNVTCFTTGRNWK